jgi:hypothetical protein
LSPAPSLSAELVVAFVVVDVSLDSLSLPQATRATEARARTSRDASFFMKILSSEAELSGGL